MTFNTLETQDMPVGTSAVDFQGFGVDGPSDDGIGQTKFVIHGPETSIQDVLPEGTQLEGAQLHKIEAAAHSKAILAAIASEFGPKAITLMYTHQRGTFIEGTKTGNEAKLRKGVSLIQELLANEESAQ